jgi:hypothetical protein
MPGFFPASEILVQGSARGRGKREMSGEGEKREEKGGKDGLERFVPTVVPGWRAVERDR